ncbi:MAG: helix-turn-helix domain-containing protein [Mobilitalea sp.]
MVGLGKKLQTLRQNRSLSQQQVSSIINTSKAAISSYEVDAREPNLTTLMKLASLYKVSVDSLLGLEKGEYLDVSSLTPEQVTIVQSIIDSYRKL